MHVMGDSTAIHTFYMQVSLSSFQKGEEGS